MLNGGAYGSCRGLESTARTPRQGLTVALFIERFLLAILATVFFGLVVLNPLKFDWTQRITLGGCIVLGAYFVAHTALRMKEPSNATGESTVKQDIQLTITRDSRPLSIDVQPHSEVQIITFQDNLTAGLQNFHNGEDTAFQWPVGLKSKNYKGDGMFRYQLLNQGTSSVYNVRIRFRIEFTNPGVMQKPLPTPTPELIVDLGWLHPRIPHVFYAVNQSKYLAGLVAPKTVTLQVEGEAQAREVPLGQLVRNPVDVVPLSLAPTRNTWEGNRIK